MGELDVENVNGVGEQSTWKRQGLSSAFLAFLFLGAGVAGSGTALAQPSADLSVDAVQHFCDSGDVENIGDLCEFLAEVFNSGPDTAESVLLTIFLPTGLELIDPTCTGTTGVITCPLGDIPPGSGTGFLFIDSIATPDLPVGIITITMQVTSSTSDPNLDNNIDVDTGEATPGGDLLGGLSVSPPPPEVTLMGDFEETSIGVPVIVRGSEITYEKDVTAHCEPGGIEPVEVKLVVGPFSGTGGTVEIPMAKVGPGEIWEGTASISENGQAPLMFYVDCPPDTAGFPADISLSAFEDEIQDAGGVIYIDPSGRILDACTDLPLDGATVTLLIEIPPGSGTFVVALEETPPITPAVNPQITLADGVYGWDVVAGTYKVEVEKTGFVTGESGALTIPPPVTGLEISLDRTGGCPPPHRGKVDVCHKGRKTLSLPPQALPAHLAHGDSLGACP